MSEVEQSMRRITVSRLKEKLDRLPDDCVLIFSPDGAEAYIEEFKLEVNDPATLEPRQVRIGLVSAK